MRRRTASRSSGVTPRPRSFRVSARPRSTASSVTPGRISPRPRRRRGPLRREESGEGSGLRLRGGRVGAGDGCGDSRPLPFAHLLHQAEPQPLGQSGREAQGAVERVVDARGRRGCASASAAARGGEEREQRRLLAGEDAALGGAGGDAGALVVAEPEADLVLLDHGHVGVRRRSPGGGPAPGRWRSAPRRSRRGAPAARRAAASRR